MDHVGFRCVGANTSLDGRWLAFGRYLVAKHPSELPSLAIVDLHRSRRVVGSNPAGCSVHIYDSGHGFGEAW